jgi:hypothetical protein
VFRFQQRVRDALESVPGGAEASSYFGIDGGVPKLSPLEAALAEQVLRGLQGVSAGDIDLLSILGTIQECNQASTIDPDILRALRQPPSRGST